MTLCVLGGSFDPPHVSHVLMAEYALSMGYADRVLVVPVFHHAFNKPLSAFELRVEMCRKAFAYQSRVFVSEMEAELPQPSYTVTTLQEIRKRWPGEPLRLLMGADVARETGSWHRFAEVARLAPPLVLGRCGVVDETYPVAVLPRVSSHEIRTWLREPQGRKTEQLLEALIPPGVREVIEREGLYR